MDEGRYTRAFCLFVFVLGVVEWLGVWGGVNG